MNELNNKIRELVNNVRIEYAYPEAMPSDEYEDALKSGIKALITEQVRLGRIDELKMLDTRSFMSTGKDAVMEVWQSDIDARIVQLKDTTLLEGDNKG